jgi:hypothetical protein
MFGVQVFISSDSLICPSALAQRGFGVDSGFLSDKGLLGVFLGDNVKLILPSVGKKIPHSFGVRFLG